MKIKGLQKTTLIDYPGKIGSTVFLFGCNFRCGFCHNPELVLEEKSPDISKEEILRFLEKRKGLLEGVCITGGEPLMTIDEEFLKRIKSIGYLVKIDTNGSFPEKLKEFIDKGLIDFVAMDIKTGKERYKEITRAGVDFDKIEESIKIISGLENYEFRTTVVEGVHDEQDIIKIVKWLTEIIGKKPKKFCIQGFKNQGKFIDESYKNKEDASREYLEKLKQAVENYVEKIEVRF